MYPSNCELYPVQPFGQGKEKVAVGMPSRLRGAGPATVPGLWEAVR